MKPIKDHSFGIVPLTYRQNFWEVFLVQHLNGAHWGFPKGRAEKGESPKQTAERELFEETGMKVIRYLDHPYFVERYQFNRAGVLIDKTARFYLAEVSTEYNLQTKEIVEGKWLALKDLLSYVTFPEEKELYLAVIRTLENL